MPDITPALRRRIDKAGKEFAAAYTARQNAAARAAEVAREASAAGMSQVELAELLGVDRARTLRRWLNTD
jgi:DNA-binding XRE family transcriptional regulator